MSVIKAVGTSSEKKNCAICKRRTPEYVQFSEKGGILIHVPCCKSCQNNIGMFLAGPMKNALSTVHFAITASKFITEDEREISRLRSGKEGGSHV